MGMDIIKNTITVGKTMFEALQAENARLREDNSALKAIQTQYAAEVATLRDENAKLLQRLDTWAGYEIYHPIAGTTVYRYIPQDGSAETGHFACPYCRDRYDIKSILQFKNANMNVGRCPACGSKYPFRQSKRFF